MNIEKGNIVKSLDFPHMDDCYYIGKVVSVSELDGTFRAETIERVWLGKADRKHSDYFVAPLPGHSMMDDLMFARVQVIA
jgi:hypothetical protein